MSNAASTAPARPDRYAAVSKWIHWIIAGIILFTLPIGMRLLYIPPGPVQNFYFDVHRSLGITVLTLAFFRVAARLYYGVPAPAASLTKFELIASTAAHHLLLTLIFLQPIVGWLSTDSFRADVSIYGLFTLPHILPQNDTMYKILSWTHFCLGYLMALTLVAHIGGALMHGVVKRDGVLNRMLPESWGRCLDWAIGRAS